MAPTLCRLSGPKYFKKRLILTYDSANRAFIFHKKSGFFSLIFLAHCEQQQQKSQQVRVEIILIILILILLIFKSSLNVICQTLSITYPLKVN